MEVNQNSNVGLTKHCIKAKNISKNFGKIEALQKVDLSFQSGLMHGLIGPEGAGKTTFIHIVVGLMKPNQGEVLFYENDNVISFAEVRNKISYMPQKQSLYSDLTIEEHLIFFKELYQIPKNEYEKRKEELLSITKLKPFLDRPAGELSGGMYKKLGLMCALLRSPEIILLDEPTNGVDPISRREFWDLLYRLLERNILIIMSTAYMDEALRCGAVHLLEEGRVIAEGAPRELLKNENVQSFDELFMKLSKEKLGSSL